MLKRIFLQCEVYQLLFETEFRRLLINGHQNTSVNPLIYVENSVSGIL